MSGGRARRTYLDVLRGVTVLIMMEAHVIDSWTRAGDRAFRGFGYSLVLGGFAAPLFLFLAGVAVPLSAGSKARRSGNPAAAARAVEKRGLEIFLLAFLFRFQSFVLSWAPAWTLLKVDILNIMGPAIVGTASLWGLFRTARARAIAFAVAMLVVVFMTPAIRAVAWLAPLPDYIEGYVRPIPGLTNFSAFPWIAFLPAGALVGLVLDGVHTEEAERRANIAFAACGGALVLGAYAASRLPPLFGPSEFWTSSASFFFLRLGIMTASIAVAYWWEQRSGASLRWSPLQVLGRNSLFVYWIHVEMVYGVVSSPLHRSMPLGGAWTALVLFWVFILGCVLAKDRTLDWWRTPRPPRAVVEHA